MAPNFRPAKLERITPNLTEQTGVLVPYFSPPSTQNPGHFSAVKMEKNKISIIDNRAFFSEAQIREIESECQQMQERVFDSFPGRSNDKLRFEWTGGESLKENCGPAALWALENMALNKGIVQKSPNPDAQSLKMHFSLIVQQHISDHSKPKKAVRNLHLENKSD